MPAKMSTGMAAYTTRLPMPEPLRWPSPMRNEPRSCFGEFAGVAIYTTAPIDGKCLVNAQYKILRMDEAKTFTAGQSKTLSRTIVPCKVKFRGASFCEPLWEFMLDASAKSLGTGYLAWEKEKFGWQNHCLTERPASHIKELLRDTRFRIFRRWGSPYDPSPP